MDNEEYYNKKQEYENKIKEANEKELNGEIDYIKYQEICAEYVKKLEKLHKKMSEQLPPPIKDSNEYLKYKLIKDYENLKSRNPENTFHIGYYKGVINYIQDLYEKLYGVKIVDYAKDFNTIREYMEYYEKYWETYNNPEEEYENLKEKW